MPDQDLIQFSSFPLLGDGKLGNCAQLALGKTLPVSRVVLAVEASASPTKAAGVLNDGGLGTRDLIPVTRHFHPDPAALDALVEALYKLLIESSDLQPASVPERPESACIRPAHE